MFVSIVEILWQSWLVLGQMAPYLLLGFLIAGVLSVCISPAWVERHLSGRGLYPVTAASLFGVPLPLCSCGVIPVSASIRRHGASRAATTSFLISTPQTGVDSIAVTYALLGPVFAVFRPIAALMTGIVGGMLAQLADRTPDTPRSGPNDNRPMTPSTACCPSENKEAGYNPVLRILHYGFITLPRDIGPALLVGVAIAGAAGALLPANRLATWLDAGIWSILLTMAGAVPIYVCATASVPIAAGLIHLGASPGAALAFLIAGPATNAAAITTIWRLVGRRVTLVYLATVGCSAVVGGLALDALLPELGSVLPEAAGHAHPMGGQLIGHVSSLLLLGVLLLSLGWIPGVRRTNPATGQTGPAAAGTTPPRQVTLNVSGMTCSHCAAAVRRTLVECPGVLRAEVDLDHGKAVVHGEQNLDIAVCAAAVADLGYQAEIAAE